MGFREKKVGFIDLAKLRFGIFKGDTRIGDTLTVRYLPPNSFTARTISNVYPGSLKRVESFDPDSPYAYFMVLMSGEYGKAPFLEQYMGPDGIIAKLIRNMKEMSALAEVDAATERSIVREQSRGAETTLKGVTDKMKMVDEATRKPFAYFQGKKQSSF